VLEVARPFAHQAPQQAGAGAVGGAFGARLEAQVDLLGVGGGKFGVALDVVGGGESSGEQLLEELVEAQTYRGAL
jgi:hypothetical protein